MNNVFAVFLGLMGLVGMASVLSALNQLSVKDAIVRRLGLGGNNKLRIAVFGGGNAWGVGLEPRFKAYPYLLSPTVQNFAHTSQGPNYFSVCTETTVGEDAMFDVIIFDYWLRCFEGLDELARRIRQRYPHAIMIFVRNWEPVHFKRKSNEHSTDKDDIQSLTQWKKENGHDGKHLQAVIRAIQNDPGYWYLPAHGQADTYIQNTAKSVKGYEFTFTQRATGKETLIDFMGYFDGNHHSHVSELGHKTIAKAINFIVHEHLTNGQEVELVNTGIHGHWGRGDKCHLWYFSGGTNMNYGGMKMREFDEHNGHFALEVNVDQPAWFSFNNRMEDNALPTRTLYVHYLTSEKEGDYPDVKITFEGQIREYLPTLNNVDKHHDIRTLAIGKVPYGETNVTITPIGTATYPFRLVGMTFSNEIAVPLEWGFGPTSSRK